METVSYEVKLCILYSHDTRFFITVCHSHWRDKSLATAKPHNNIAVLALNFTPRVYRPLTFERVYLQIYKVEDTSFQLQDDNDMSVVKLSMSCSSDTA